MSVFNNENTLEEAVNSILNQTETDLELIVFDDASTDRSYSILKKMAEKDQRIRLFQNPKNMGLAYSLNEGLKRAAGKYIARMDGDDISEINRFAVQKAYLERHPDVDLVGSAMQVFDEKGDHEIIYTLTKPHKTDVPRSAPFSHATVMMKTEVLKHLGGYLVSERTRRTEDMELWYRFFQEGCNGVNLQEPLYKVRVDRQAIKKRKLKDALDACWITRDGVSRLNLPVKYYLYTFKPLVSYLIPERIKKHLRNSD